MAPAAPAEATARPNPRGSIGRIIAAGVLPHQGVMTAALPPTPSRKTRSAAAGIGGPRRAASVGAVPSASPSFRQRPVGPVEPPRSTPPSRAAGPPPAEAMDDAVDDLLGAALRAALAETAEEGGHRPSWSQPIAR